MIFNDEANSDVIFIRPWALGPPYPEGTSTLSSYASYKFLIITSFKAPTVLNLVVLVSLSPYSKSVSRRTLVTSLPEGDSPDV